MSSSAFQLDLHGTVSLQKYISILLRSDVWESVDCDGMQCTADEWGLHKISFTLMLSCAAQGCTVLKWFQESTKQPPLCTQPTAKLNRNPFHSTTDHLTGKGKFFCDKLQTPCTTGKPPPTTLVEYFDFFQAGVGPPPYFENDLAFVSLKSEKCPQKYTAGKFLDQNWECFP